MKYVWNVNVIYGRRDKEEVMIASSEDEVAERISQRNGRMIDASINWNDTVSLLTQAGFPAREMSNVYRTVARRVQAGAKQEDAFGQAAAFVTNAPLRVALADIASAISGGERIENAMQAAGLPENDCALVRALSPTGGAAEALSGLADSWAQTASLKTKLKAVITEPLMYNSISAVLVWVSFIFFMPFMSGAIKRIGFHLPHHVIEMYAFDAFLNQHPIFWSIVYWGMLSAVLWVLFRAEFMRRLYRRLPFLKTILERSDAAQALMAFSLLYDSGINRAVIASRVADACGDPKLKDAFARLSYSIDAGENIGEASRKADFPEFLAPTMVGSLSSNDPRATIDDLKITAKVLAEDVEAFTEQFIKSMRLFFTATNGAVLFLVFMVTLGPVMTVPLANA